MFKNNDFKYFTILEINKLFEKQLNDQFLIPSTKPVLFEDNQNYSSIVYNSYRFKSCWKIIIPRYLKIENC